MRGEHSKGYRAKIDWIGRNLGIIISLQNESYMVWHKLRSSARQIKNEKERPLNYCVRPKIAHILKTQSRIPSIPLYLYKINTEINIYYIFYFILYSMYLVRKVVSSIVPLIIIALFKTLH